MRRIRMTIAGALVGVVVTFGLAAPAHASGESEEGCLIEVVEEAEAAGEPVTEEAIGDDVAACFEAPNPLMPEINEVIWGAFGFFTVLGFLYWKGYPAIKKTMDARTERIQGDLDAAEAQRSEAGTVLSEYQAQLADARTESARIIEEARQSADEVKASLVAKAEADVAEMRTRAAADVDAAKSQAVTDLRGEVATLAIAAAEQVVGRSLDQETNTALVEAYIDQVGASS